MTEKLLGSDSLGDEVRINFVVALSAEARHIVDHFGLTAVPGAGRFSVYESRGLQLIVSGVGKVACATAVGMLAGKNDSGGAGGPTAWINTGIAGHKDADLGTVFCANKVSEDTSPDTYYPQFVFEPPCPSRQVHTVMKPESTYDAASLFDMEASGFCKACSHFTTAEWVHLVKVVSDNQKNDSRNLTPQIAKELMAESLPVLDQLVQRLCDLLGAEAQHLRSPVAFEELSHRLRFSVTQKRLLFRLLQKCEALSISERVYHECMSIDRPKPLLKRLEELVAEESLRFRLGDKGA